MTRLRRDHMRLLGNGYRTRPAELVCTCDQVRENCTFFQTSIEFRPVPQRQHHAAAAKQQAGRQELFAHLLTGLDTQAS